jgi:hypothetical protein
LALFPFFVEKESFPLSSYCLTFRDEKQNVSEEEKENYCLPKTHKQILCGDSCRILFFKCKTKQNYKKNETLKKISIC